MLKRCLFGVFPAFLIACQESPSYLLREVDPSDSGLAFTNQLRESPELNILNYLYYYNGAGVLAADFNGDNLPDLYLAANQQADALYLNRGGMRFEEVTAQTGISNADGWTTGVTHADVNGDGLLDIYICKAAGYRALNGRNLLYVNQGLSPAGIPQFKEMAAEYGLDFSGLSTQAAFFDYDLDGDLDLFLLNHSVHPNRTYGKGSMREGYDPLSGDRLYRNDGGHFTDVSGEAGIFQGKAGYGLGLGISDVNNDGYPDIYVGNDFFENDYLYLNLGNGSFAEAISSSDPPIGHTTHYSMGNDLADLNNDGLPDIVSLDMLPEDLVTYKTSGLEYGYPIYQQYLRHGYAPQYMQNTLQLNLGGGRFSEVGFLSGLAATEWSWGSLMADFDNDGYKDVFISNGIKGATNDMDYMNFIANEDIQRRIDKGMEDTDLPLTREIPSKKVPNYIFRNNGDLSFTDMTGTWMASAPSFSNGCAYADFDGDGDLDLVVNQVDAPASLLENQGAPGTSLELRFAGTGANTRGIGAKVLAYTVNQIIAHENNPARGYLSAVPPTVHLGLGPAQTLDSLVVVWPGGAWQALKQVPAKGSLELRQSEASGQYYARGNTPVPAHWARLDSLVGFTHRENMSLDFDREPLIVYAGSNQGPAVAVADLNRDGRDDFFICGAKRQASALYLQQADGIFEPAQEALFEADALREDTAPLFFDADGDGYTDLLVASGGNEFQNGEPLQPRLYLNKNGQLQPPVTLLEGIFPNASGIDTLDIDRDGDTDLLITADAVPGSFGETPRHYLLTNDGTGQFHDATEQVIPALLNFGAVSGVTWADLDGDGAPELAVAGPWSAVAVFKQTGGKWERVKGNGLDQTEGWWNALKAADLDGDGDLDLLAANWGLNSKFRASPEAPVRLYRADFDGNGSVEPLVTYYHKGVETPFASRDELAKQMPFLNKKYRSYQAFARASLAEVFGQEALEGSVRKEVAELASCLFLNDGKGHFLKKPLPRIAQASALYDFGIADFDGDGLPDLFPVGNLYEISTQLGRLDAVNGLILHNAGNGNFVWDRELTAPLSGACREIDTLRVAGTKTFIITRNNDTPVFLTQVTH